MSPYRTVLAIFAMATFVGAHSGMNDTSLEVSQREHSRDILVKRARDCGTFTIYCGGQPKLDGSPRAPAAPMACANACYYINTFMDGSFSTTYRDGVNNDRNREQSGCNARAGSVTGQSVCNSAPFSQRFHDPLESYSTSPTFGCDEFPMADMSQPDWAKDGIPRNTLRCIPPSDNGGAGAQLGNFVDGTGWYSGDESKNGGRSNTCSGPLQDGDTYKVAFNYDGDDGFDKSKIPFCKEADGTPLMDEQLWDDRNEFYMTQLSPRANTGKIDFPYVPNDDNKYADGATRENIFQCSVVVYRTGDAGYEADVVYGDGSFGEGKGSLENDDDYLIVTPPDGNNYEPLKVMRTAPLGTGDGSDVSFFYAMDDESMTNVDLYYAWGSKFVGADDTMNRKKPDGVTSDLKGRYCYWTQVDTGQDPPTQSITCYFPCHEPADD